MPVLSRMVGWGGNFWKGKKNTQVRGFCSNSVLTSVNLTIWGFPVLIGLVKVFFFYSISLANVRIFPLEMQLIIFFFARMALFCMPTKTHCFRYREHKHDCAFSRNVSRWDDKLVSCLHSYGLVQSGMM